MRTARALVPHLFHNRVVERAGARRHADRPCVRRFGVRLERAHGRGANISEIGVRDRGSPRPAREAGADQ